MNRFILIVLAALLLASSSFAGLDGPGGPGGPGDPGDPGEGGGGDLPGDVPAVQTTTVIDPTATMLSLFEELWPFMLAAIAFSIASQAAQQGPAWVVEAVGGKPAARGFVPKSTGNADLDLAQAKGYLQAREREVKRAVAREYRDHKRRGASGSYSRSRSSSRGRRR